MTLGHLTAWLAAFHPSEFIYAYTLENIAVVFGFHVVEVIDDGDVRTVGSDLLFLSTVHVHRHGLKLLAAFLSKEV